MIFDCVDNISKYYGISCGLNKAINYIKKKDFYNLDFGTYEIEGSKILPFFPKNTFNELLSSALL